MTKRTHRILSLFIAIFLLLTGMYANTITAEALSIYDLAAKTTAILSPIYSDINDAAICTAELPTVHNMEPQSRERYQDHYREIHELLYLQYSGPGSLSQGKSCIYHAATSLYGQTQNELVTKYMHQSDGKKRL